MNDGQLDDLKQFVAATVSQTEARLTERIDGIDQRIDGIDQRLESLEENMKAGFASVRDAIEEINNQQARSESNIAKLKQKLA
jgi:flagellar capping protein FliD